MNLKIFLKSQLVLVSLVPCNYQRLSDLNSEYLLALVVKTEKFKITVLPYSLFGYLERVNFLIFRMDVPGFGFFFLYLHIREYRGWAVKPLLYFFL